MQMHRVGSSARRFHIAAGNTQGTCADFDDPVLLKALPEIPKMLSAKVFTFFFAYDPKNYIIKEELCRK